MTQSTPNPFTLPQDLYDAERELANHLEDGDLCWFGGDGIPEAPIESGSEANVIRGPVLRFFACGGDAEHPVQGKSIRLEGAWITGYPEDDHGLDLAGANIPCRLDFIDCHFAAPVKLQRSHCAGLFFTGCRFADRVNMEYAKCAEVNIRKSHLEWGLAAERLATEGDMYLHAISTKGEVRLLGANIGGDLSCTDGTFHNSGGCALNAGNAKIGGSLTWQKMSGDGFVILSRANADVLDDDMESWKPFNFVLGGFTYNQFAAHADAESRIKWLADHSDGGTLSPSLYEQAAKVLRSMGKDIDAWDIEREKRRLEREERDSQNALRVPLWRRLWGRGIDALTDFVYRPWKTLGAAVLVVVAGACLFNFADDNGRMVPHQPVVLANAEYREATNSPCAEFKCPPEKRPTELVKRLFPDYPEFNALVYSADVFIPFFALHQEPYWYPNPSGSDREILLLILPFWYWLEIGAGWVLTSLFLLSITGLLRPRQSSGEKG